VTPASLRILAALLSLLTPVGLRANCADVLRQLEGWTILSVTSVDGEFEGCDFGRKIKLEDGSVLTCAEYNYTYSYDPDAVVFGKRVSINGHTFMSIRLIVEDEVFEMEPKVARD
jgi:hypothetical protein